MAACCCHRRALVTVTAGVGHFGLLADTPAEDWDRVVGVNAKGVWLVMRALAVATSPLGGQARERARLLDFR